MTVGAPPLLPAPGDVTRAEPSRSWSGREHARRNAGVLVIAAALVGLLVVTFAAAEHGSVHGVMDPASYDQQGGRALATLLQERGVAVRRLNDVDQVVAAATARTTVVVADPDGQPDLAPLRRLPAGATLVLVEPGAESLSVLQPGIELGGSVDRQTIEPGCRQPDAVLAGSLETGGDTFLDATGSTTASCFSGTVHEQPRPGGGATIDLGSAETLSNQDLGQQGNAAFGIGLLSHQPTVLWLVPGPVAAPTGGTTPLNQLLPKRLGWAIDQVLVAVALLMLWRARRHGRVVAEPLPVPVRASETVEGLGRLYRSGRSRRRAGTALQLAARSRMAPRLGLRRDDQPHAVVEAVSARTGRPAAEVAALLYGAEPGDDPALVALADQLDALEAEVRRS